MKRLLLFITMFASLFLVSCGSDKKEVAIGNGDAQNGWPLCRFAEAGTGYYYSQQGFVVDGNPIENLIRITYLDTKTNKSKVWCYKSECDHTTELCNGVFRDDKWCYPYIFFNAGKVFMVSYDDKGYFLESFDEDGSNQTRICKICDRDKDLYTMNIHRENVYYTNIEGVFRVSLADGTSECIKHIDNPLKQSVNYIYLLNDMLYFPLSNVDGDIFGEDVHSEIFSYNIGSKEVKSLFAVYQVNLLYFVTLDNENIIYYKDNNGLCKHNVISGDETIIFREEGQLCRNIATNGKYIFIDNSKEKVFHNELYGIESDEMDSNCQIQIVSLDGKLLKSYDYTIWAETFFYGEKYLFRYGNPVIPDEPSEEEIEKFMNTNRLMYYISADDLVSENDNWIEGWVTY